MEDKVIAQKLFLDSDSEDELKSHFSDSDSDQDETRRHILSGVTRQQLAGSETCFALVRERDAAQV